MPRLLPLFLLALGAAVLAACDLAPKEGDEEYLEEFCRQTNIFSDTLVEADDPPSIEAAITAYADALRGLQPPEDVREFNDEFVAYVESLIDDPAGVAATDPPEPDSDVKRRLDAQAGDIDACQSTSYFGE